ncbi:MAG: hypothetical protein ABIJ91_04510, partial [Candidatus Kuenenbacteria bacterium]
NNNNNNNLKSSLFADGFFLLSEATNKCCYSQEYLSLLARRGDLKAEKFGRNWYTTMVWLREYIDQHPIQKKGNIKGKIVCDEQYKKIVEQSGLNESVANLIDKFVIKDIFKCRAEFLKLHKFFVKIFFAMARVFSFRAKKKQICELSVSGDFDIARNQILVSEYIDRRLKFIEGLSLAEHIQISYPLLARIGSPKKIQKYYPFGAGLNKYILEGAIEIVESKIDKIKINFFAWFAGFLRDKMASAFFLLRITIGSFLRSPIFVVRYWSIVPTVKKIRVASSMLLFFLLMGASVFSQIDYKTTSSLYDQSREVAVNALDYTKSELIFYRKIAQKQINSFGPQSLNLSSGKAKGRVAGIATYSLPMLTFEKVFSGLDNINQAKKELAQRADNFSPKDVYENLLSNGFNYGLEGLKNIKRTSTFLSKKESVDFEVKVFIKTADAILSLNRGIGRLNPFLDGDQSFDARGFRSIDKDLKIAWNKISYEISREDNFMYKAGGAWAEYAVQTFLSNLTGLPKIKENSRKAVVLAKESGSELTLSFGNYLSSFVDPTRKVLADKTGKYTKLEKLAANVVEAASYGLSKSGEYFDSLFNKTKDSLGDSYLALLDTLNLQPAYPHRATDRTLLGQGDKPLDLQGGQKGIDDNALVVVPLEERALKEKDGLAERIRSTFSDEVEVVPDEDSASGIIRPTDKAVSFEDYMYVVVPLRGEEE